MSVFISKIQHGTFEKGEFLDEKVRTLTETLELIKAFPWDAERNLTDIQLTGPSVTIQNDNGSFLKVSLYFNNKFCVYYLRRDAVYEYHTADMQTACDEVINFFDGKLDISKYSRDMFAIGARRHFETDNFEYRLKPWRVLTLNTLMLIYAGGISVFASAILIKFYFDLYLALFTSLFLLFAIILWLIIGKTVYTAFNNRHSYLKISKGNDLFLYGSQINEVKTYSKANIEAIISYVAKGYRNPILIEIYEIRFKDRNVIKLSNMLISGTTFLSKFSDNRNCNKIKVIQGKGLIKKI